jgi:hypothetical protein
MSTKPRSTAFTKKVQELYGGLEGFERALDVRSRDFHTAWSQNGEQIGRILRCHLAVEHFLTRVIEEMNPSLGSLSHARVTFSQKLELADTRNPIISSLQPGLRRLNQIRNRIAHQLSATVTESDRDAILAISFFRVAYESEMRPYGAPSNEPLRVLEQFSEFAASMLHTLSGPGRDEFDAAVRALTETDDGSDVPVE